MLWVRYSTFPTSTNLDSRFPKFHVFASPTISKAFSTTLHVKAGKSTTRPRGASTHQRWQEINIVQRRERSISTGVTVFRDLHEAFQVLQVEIELDDFVVRHADGSPRCITTLPARQYFGQCLDPGRNGTIASCIKAHEDLAKLVKLVDWNIRRYVDTLSPTSWRMSEVLPLDTIICIQVLGESLINVARLPSPYRGTRRS